MLDIGSVDVIRKGDPSDWQEVVFYIVDSADVGWLDLGVWDLRQQEYASGAQPVRPKLLPRDGFVENEDYYLTYEYSSDGSYCGVIVNGIGQFYGSSMIAVPVVDELSFTPYSECVVEVVEPEGGFVYDGTEKRPEVRVTDPETGKALVRNANYSVSYASNVGAGTATVRIAPGAVTTGYGGYAEATFEIVPADLSGATIEPIKGRGYDGKPYEPRPKVTLNGKTLVEGTDFDFSYRGNVYASNGRPATLTVTGKGNYAGAKEASFEVWRNGQPMTAWAVARQAPAASLKTRDVTVEPPIHVAHAVSAGRPLEFRKMGGDSRLAVDLATGRVTVRRGTPAGTYKVTIRAIAFGGSNYADGSRTVECQVKVVAGKLDQGLQVTAGDVVRTSLSLAASDYLTRPFSVAMAAGNVTYRRAGGSGCLDVDASGRLRIARGTPAGTYYAKVWATAAGDAGYRPCTRTVTVKVVVR